MTNACAILTLVSLYFISEFYWGASRRKQNEGKVVTGTLMTKYNDVLWTRSWWGSTEIIYFYLTSVGTSEE